MFYYSSQGLAQSVYETCGNFITLNLWQGLSESPINAVHAGYGIGALLSIQLARPFIHFDPYKSSHHNATSVSNTTDYVSIDQEHASEINLRVPYWLCGALAFSVGVLFFLAQLIENRNEKRLDKNRYTQLVPLTEEFELDLDNFSGSTASIELIKDGDNEKETHIESEQPRDYYILYLIMFLFLFVFIQGYMTVICRFMLTYLTLGPAKFQVEQFARAQTLFWLFFILGRFVVSFLAFRLTTYESVVFFLAVLGLNFLVNFLFIVPALTQFSAFFWLNVSLLGLISGPMTPTCLMLAKQLINFQPFVLSLFVACLGLGGILFQQATGALLDMQHVSFNWMIFMDFNAYVYNTAYLIPYVSCVASLFCFLFFLPVYCCLKRKYSR